MPADARGGRKPADTPLGVMEDELCLVVLEGAARGKRHVIDRECIMGRSVEADVLVDDPEVSRSHARLRRDASGPWFLEDLGSRNGTYLNNLPIKNAILAFGDKLRLGSAVLVVSRYNPVEQRLRQRQRLETLGRLATGVTHDLNNMQQAVATSVAFLERMGPDATFGDPLVRECLTDLAAASARSSELAACLLGYARGGSDVHTEVNLSQICREVARLASRTFGHGIDVNTDVKPYLRVLGSGAELHQVIMNLCVNARDAMPRGGTLSVSATLLEAHDLGGELASGPHVVITVTDTGTGMDATTRMSAFEPFFTTKEAGEGAGLGLAMARDIVTAHGGIIELSSEVGQGTTARVCIPAHKTAGIRAMALTKPDAEVVPLAESVRILLVEDEPLVRKSLSRVLSGAGYQVVTAADGMEGVRLYLDGPRPQLVILDLQMPHLGGPDTLAVLRGADPGVRVLFITGQPEETVEKVARAYGVGVGLLRKPFSSEELLDAAARALKASHEIDDTVRRNR
ncbi:MAG TPA: ATP-binding protein [Polyangiaceae bacterium]|nr:ATP-binding protein [Polyangiaceae bacterium]